MMHSRWTEQGEREALRRWQSLQDDALALRLYSARLLGADQDLVLHGGGNVSLKSRARLVTGREIDTLRIKGSGHDLAALDVDGMPDVALEPLRELGSLASLDEETMEREVRRALLDPCAPAPSIETLLHALLPCRYVDHTHADAVLALTNQDEGERLVAEALGEDAAFVAYVYPGFDLARAVLAAYQANPSIEGIVLGHHGLITFGDDARSAYERHIDLVERCERFLARRPPRRSPGATSCTSDDTASRAARVAPLLRGLLARLTGDSDRPRQPAILEWRCGPAVLDQINRVEAGVLAGAGPLTTDHLIRTRARFLHLDELGWEEDDDSLAARLGRVIDSFRESYGTYLTHESTALPLTDRRRAAVRATDLSPRVVLLAGAGAFCWGPTKKDAVVAADIVEHTLAAQAAAQGAGTYRGLDPAHLFRMEFRPQQLAKLSRGENAQARGALDGRVVVISGGAGAIGAAIAEVCAEAGAHVVVTDISEERLSLVERRVNERCGPGRAHGLVMDVTDERSVRAGYDSICRLYGGVDVIVPNAGIAHVAPVTDLELVDFKRVLEINLVGMMLFMREGARLLKRQGIGGHIIINSSKNVFGPGKDFGAYSASKSGGHQLGKIAAIELAPYGIRVNMLNADAVFGDEEIPSGLWAEVGPGRAKSRGMELQDLPDYYRRRNLLKARITGRHVGNAVVFFASSRTPTTGATLPIDGGVVEAFPR